MLSLVILYHAMQLKMSSWWGKFELSFSKKYAHHDSELALGTGKVGKKIAWEGKSAVG